MWREQGWRRLRKTEERSLNNKTRDTNPRALNEHATILLRRSHPIRVVIGACELKCVLARLFVCKTVFGSKHAFSRTQILNVPAACAPQGSLSKFISEI